MLREYKVPSSAGAINDSSRRCTSMIIVLQNLLPVNEHMDDTRGKLLGVRKRRVILNLRGVKDDQIGIIPGS